MDADSAGAHGAEPVRAVRDGQRIAVPAAPRAIVATRRDLAVSSPAWVGHRDPARARTAGTSVEPRPPKPSRHRPNPPRTPAQTQTAAGLDETWPLWPLVRNDNPPVHHADETRRQKHRQEAGREPSGDGGAHGASCVPGAKLIGPHHPTRPAAGASDVGTTPGDTAAPRHKTTLRRPRGWPIEPGETAAMAPFAALDVCRF